MPSATLTFHESHPVPACQPPALLSINLILVLDFTATNPKVSSRQPMQDLLKSQDSLSLLILISKDSSFCPSF